MTKKIATALTLVLMLIAAPMMLTACDPSQIPEYIPEPISYFELGKWVLEQKIDVETRYYDAETDDWILPEREYDPETGQWIAPGEVRGQIETIGFIEFFEYFFKIFSFDYFVKSHIAESRLVQH